MRHMLCFWLAADVVPSTLNRHTASTAQGGAKMFCDFITKLPWI